MFANVSKDKDIVDATAKSTNVVALSVRAVSQNFSGWLALSDLNMNLEPYTNPHRIRAKTRKNISFAYFIDLNIAALRKSDRKLLKTTYKVKPFNEGYLY